MAPWSWKSSKFFDALTSQPVGRDACDTGQSVGCSTYMAIVTRNDFDCVHEMNFLTKGKIKRTEEKRNEHLREGAEEKKREKEKKEERRRTFFLGNYRWHSV